MLLFLGGMMLGATLGAVVMASLTLANDADRRLDICDRDID